ncbi:porin [Massilia sp. ST3]|uniref:porin n=1 Tax=Massilia sp. ST3 TaxID=2824903 RepID=UPI001B84260B|nr:porin [Massilia sp. ST3]MBQ5948668.1 porin [Massilia sp. ST3]
MSKTLRHSAAACVALCAASACAQTDVQVYGRLNVAAETMRKGDDGSQVRIVNNRSVLGLRGSEDLGGGLKALFQVEGTLAPDTGAGEIARRDTRIGLDGGFGTLFLGHWTTAYTGATSSLDPFYPTTAGTMSILANGAAPSADNGGSLASFDRRQANSLHYWSRPWHGLSLRLTHGVNEERPAGGARPALHSAALLMERGAWQAVLAHERHRDYQGPGSHDSGTKAALAHAFGATRVALVAERLKYGLASGKLARNAAYVSLSHQLGALGLRAGLGWAGDGKGAPGSRIGFVRGGEETGALHLTLGMDVALSKRSGVYAYVTRLDNEAAAAYDFAINGLGQAPGVTLRGAALGLRHAF